jgi:outer membrane immunogenic protein
MHTTKLLLSVAIGSIGLSGMAAAADLPARAAPYTKAPAMVAVYDWSGFYIGGHIGGGWTDEHASFVGTTGLPLDPVGTAYGANRSGFLGGAQAGYNAQFQNFVVGIGGDFSWTDSSANTATAASLIPGATSNTLSRTHWYGTVTGRVGYAVNNVLLYAKGGAAFTEEVYGGSTSFGGFTVGTFNNQTTTRTGYVVGAGLEYGFAPNWTAFVEYNYLDFGSRSYTLLDSSGTFTASFNVKDDVNIVKGGINYKFGGPVVARY